MCYKGEKEQGKGELRGWVVLIETMIPDTERVSDTEQVGFRLAVI